MRKLIMFLALSFALCNSSLAIAEIPHLINYQGRLTDSGGSPVADGVYNITFRIYDDPNTGTLLWEEPRTGVQVQKGIFNIILPGAKKIPGDCAKRSCRIHKKDVRAQAWRFPEIQWSLRKILF